VTKKEVQKASVLTQRSRFLKNQNVDFYKPKAFFL